jgi:hypothetical protein
MVYKYFNTGQHINAVNMYINNRYIIGCQNEVGITPLNFL